MNDTLFFFFYNFAHQSVFFDRIIVFFAVYFPYAVIIFAGLFILMHHEVFKTNTPWEVLMEKKKEVSIAFLAGILAWVVSKILKLIIHTPRPFDMSPQVHSLFTETGYAFPSGHATFFMALAVSIYFYHKKAGYWFILFAVVIGLARIMAGVHFPVDILGGFILGAVIAYFVKNV